MLKITNVMKHMSELVRKKRDYIGFILSILATGVVGYATTFTSSTFIFIWLYLIYIFCVFEALYSITTYDIKKWSEKYKAILCVGSALGIIVAGIVYFILKKKLIKNEQ